MKSIIGIRTHKWTDEEARLADQLRGTFGDDVYAVFHNPPTDLDPGVSIVPVDDAWVEAQNLRKVPDWGWRCGDYFYYALRQAQPDAAHYWLIEPDVFFTSEPRDFFQACAPSVADGLGFAPAPFPHSIRFTRGLPGLEHHRAIFALTRMSGRALDFLLEARQAYSASGVFERAYTNDELFVFSHLNARDDMSVGDLRDQAPDWFEGVQFATNPDILDGHLMRSGTPDGRVYHPVRSAQQFKNTLAERLATSTSFLPRMAASVRTLSDDDIDEVMQAVEARLRATLGHYRR